MKIEIPSGARARAPFGNESVAWESGIGNGWILVEIGKVIEFPSLEVTGETPLSKGIGRSP